MYSGHSADSDRGLGYGDSYGCGGRVAGTTRGLVHFLSCVTKLRPLRRVTTSLMLIGRRNEV